jgi:cation transport regulator ChaC
LHTWLGSLDTFNGIVQLDLEKALTSEKIAVTHAEFVGRTEKARAYLFNVMKELAECPPSDATIH